jgi:hypothetical protein
LELPPLLKTWQQLQTHPYKEGFLAAADKEYKALKAKGTFEVVEIKDIGKAYIIPNIWVYTYKFDIDDFLDRYKARLMVRGDLTRSIYEDTYIATLAVCIFRALIVITAYFNLDLY